MLDGRIVAGPIVRGACQRHLNDLKRHDIVWDLGAALRAISFFSRILRLNAGKFESIPFNLEPWQAFVVGSIFGWKRLNGQRRFRWSYVETGKGSGKSPLSAGVGLYMLTADGEARAEVYAAAPLALDTPVPTPTGWTTQGDLKVGDQVFDENGRVCTVTYLSPILNDQPCFEVEFDDGTTIVADANHRWQTEDTRGQRPGLYPPTVVTTAQIRETLRSPFGRLRHRIPVAGSIHLPEAELPIDPYVLGVWLGDGRSNRGMICAHSSDSQVVEKCGHAGYEILDTHRQGSVCYFTLRGLRGQLRVHGLLDNKHVPSAYLRASERQRFELLRGLMDTDATCTKTGECRFTNRNLNIASAVHELATGLGFRANLRTIAVTGRPHYVVSFKASTDRPVFTLDRKALRQRDKIDARATARYIRSVKRVPSVPVRCIEVNSPSHLYLVTRAHIATHNTKKDQAMVLFRDAVAMFQQSPELRARLTPSGGNPVWQLTYLTKASWFKPISNDDGQSGPRPSCALIDELHEHPDAKTVEMLEAGFKFRENPLMFMITNSGSDQTSVCWKYHDLVERIVTGLAEDDEVFGYVCALDEGDDPFEDESCWIKANPSLGVTIRVDYLRSRIAKARNLPDKRNECLRLNFCVWTDADAAWMTKPVWAAVQKDFPIDELRGRKAWLGADLAVRNDLVALSVVVEDGVDDEQRRRFKAWVEFWLPREKLKAKEDADGQTYGVWVEQGHLHLSEGNFVRQEFVAKRLVELADLLDVQKVAYDEYAVKWLEIALDDLGADLPLIEHPQGFRRGKMDEEAIKAAKVAGESPPAGLWMPDSIQKTEELIVEQLILVKPNPILTWNIASATFERDAQDNRKLSKRKSTGKIDGAVALVMGCGAALNAQGGDGKSVYATRGALTV